MALFASARFVDLVLAFVVLEALLLLVMRRRAPGGLQTREILALLLPGACLMLALRAALTGPSAPAIAGWMLAALFAHLGDLALRWRAAARRGTNQ
jgi:hypothetical protein